MNYCHASGAGRAHKFFTCPEALGSRRFAISTWRPTRILLVKAPSGKDAWTRGTVVLLRIPPSGPIWLLSCLIRETTAKYWGKSLVMILQIRFVPNSSGLSSSGRRKGWEAMSRCLCTQPRHEQVSLHIAPWHPLVFKTRYSVSIKPTLWLLCLPVR